MPKVWKTSIADRDLCEIYLYVGHEDRGPAGAVRLAEVFDKAFAFYASNPLLGTLRPELGEGYRIFSCGTKSNPNGWLVVYRPYKDGIQILRIFRSGQDYFKLF